MALFAGACRSVILHWGETNPSTTGPPNQPPRWVGLTPFPTNPQPTRPEMGWKEHVPNQPIDRAGGKMRVSDGQHGLGRRFSTGVKLGLGDPVHRLLLIRQRAL